MKKNGIIILYCILGIILFFGFFYGLGSYPLLDVDETRYVDMARGMFNSKDYLTLYLNREYFFEKPPLYFWLECISFHIFGGRINEWTARLPIVILSLLPTGFLIALCRKIKNDLFAIVTTTVLFTSLEYVILTKIAILDSVLTSLVACSVLCYFLTFFVQDKNKKYFWILTYIFSGLAVMAKGIPGVAIPALIIFVSSFVFKSWKETFKYSWGILLFLLLTLPWHIIMLKMYPHLFFREYIYKHHILRFLGSKVIGRVHPWYFLIVTLLWGLFPHIFVLFSKIKPPEDFKLNLKDDYTKFMILNSIAVVTILLFFSSSATKLITYILPIYPFFAVLIGAIWYKFINYDDRAVKISLIVLNTIFSIAAIGMIFCAMFLPPEIYIKFQQVQKVSLFTLIPFSILNWIFILKNMRLKLFMSLGLMMALTLGIVTPCAFNFIYAFGQDDLMNFAQYARENKYTISTYLTGGRFSLLYYSHQPKIIFKTEEDTNWLRQELKKKNNIVIARNREIQNLPLKIKKRGIKYSIIQGGTYEE